jgi:hypothetical protein
MRVRWLRRRSALVPVPRRLGAEVRYRVGVAGHGVVGEVASHHACQPLALPREGLMPASLELNAAKLEAGLGALVRSL